MGYTILKHSKMYLLLNPFIYFVIMILDQLYWLVIMISYTSHNICEPRGTIGVLAP